jgi:hypothetical protein
MASGTSPSPPSSSGALGPADPALTKVRDLTRAAIRIALVAACTCAFAQERKPGAVLPPVTVTGQQKDTVEKSFRKMNQGMDLFERQRAMAPQARLRFKLLPRRPGTNMDHVLLEVVGSTFAYEVPIAQDHTFTLARDPKALQENAVVSPNRKRLSMTWRTDIRTPGLPPNTRRLGDLRLECQVGMTADLVSNNNPVITGLINLFSDPKAYCEEKNPHYLFFADRPVFSVTLVSGSRREVLPIDQLYAAASDDPGLKNDLPYCDCEVLVDRTYFLPLGNRSWPDDALVEFEYMEDAR